MAPTPSRSGLTPAQQRERRSKIMAGALSLVLVVVLVIQLPRLLKGNHPTTAVTAAPAPSSATSSASATPSLGSTVAAGSVPVGAPPPGQLISFTHFALKDPFDVPGTTTTSASTSPASTTSKGSAGASGSSGSSGSGSQRQPSKQPATKTSSKSAKSTKAKTVKFKAKPQPPNAALISMNGKQQLVPVGVSFPANGPLFKLVTLSKKVIHIGVLGGSFTTGSPTLAVKPGQKLTLDNEANGSRYEFKLVKLVTATSAQLAAATPGATGSSAAGGSSPSSSSSSGTTTTASTGTQPSASTTTQTTTTAATTTAATTTTATTTTG